MATSLGVDYRWPPWDVRLVQQYLSTPSLEKLGPRGIGRYLHRRAIAGVVPQRVAWKPSKDMGYGQLRERSGGEGLIRQAERARALEADLHPTLAELIDRDKLRGQIQRSAQGPVPGEAGEGFAFQYGRSIGHLRWLDLWLKGEAA